MESIRLLSQRLLAYDKQPIDGARSLHPAASISNRDNLMRLLCHHKPLLVVMSLLLSEPLFALNIAPQVTEWEYRLCQPSSMPASLGNECTTWTQGTWNGTLGGGCTNEKNPFPWTSESLLIPNAIAFYNGTSASTSGWLAPGQKLPDNNCWTGPPGEKYGIETSNVLPIVVSLSNGSTGSATGYRGRSLICPTGYTEQTDGSCALTGIDPHKNNKTCPAGDNGSNPIHSALGIKHQQEDDFHAAGESSLHFVRYYTSANTWEPSGLGNNWRHWYSRHISLTASTVKTTVTVFRHDGDRYYFNLATGGTWVGDADVNGRLVQLASSSGWRYTNEDNQIEIYDGNGLLTSIIDADGRKQTLTYSTASTPRAIAYSSGLLINVTDDTGRTLDFFYDQSNRLIRLMVGGFDIYGGVAFPRTNIIYAYSYDASNNLSTVAYPDETNWVSTDNPVKTYLYTDTRFPHALTGINDENGDQYATWVYDASGAAISSEHAGGVSKTKLTYNVDANGSTDVTDALLTSRRFSFQTILGVKKLSGLSQPAGAGCSASAANLTYDGNGNIASTKDFNLNQNCYLYDSARNLETMRIEGIEPGGTCPASATSFGIWAPVAGTVARKISTEWHPYWRLATRQAEPKKRTTWVYNGRPDPTNGSAIANCAPLAPVLPNGQSIAVVCKKIEEATSDTTGALGFTAPTTGVARVWKYTYNAMGQVLTVDGPRTDVTDVTTYAYYPSTAAYRGDLQTVTNAVGQITQYTHGTIGHVSTMVDPNGTKTDYVYNAIGNIKTVTRSHAGSASLVTTYEYYPTARLKSVTQSDGTKVTYTYDSAHRLTGVSDLAGNNITYVLDKMGNRASEMVKDPAGVLSRQISRVPDALNRLQTITGAVQ